MILPLLLLLSPSESPPSWYTAQIAPIFEAHCVSCHGAERGKAGLRLHAPDAIRAGLDDEVAGELLRRIGTPVSDDDHMPPDGSPQLALWQVETLDRWIAAGVPIDVETPRQEETVAPRELPPAAMAALRAAHVHVEIIDPKARLLWIDFTAVPALPGKATDDVARMLKPLAPSVSELSLRGVASADAILTRCGPWDQLRGLDLSGAFVGRDGLTAAAKSGRLVELTLVGATLTDDAAAALLDLKSIRHLHVWGANVPAEILDQLRTRDTLVLNEGSVEPPAPVDIEPEFAFGKPKAVALSLEPVNTKCPVAGVPVDGTFSIVHEGRVIAFCCKDCPGRFWEDPTKFPVVADRP